jgi:hypothetical protein
MKDIMLLFEKKIQLQSLVSITITHAEASKDLMHRHGSLRINVSHKQAAREWIQKSIETNKHAFLHGTKYYELLWFIHFDSVMFAAVNPTMYTLVQPKKC